MSSLIGPENELALLSVLAMVRAPECGVSLSMFSLSSSQYTWARESGRWLTIASGQSQHVVQNPVSVLVFFWYCLAW